MRTRITAFVALVSAWSAIVGCAGPRHTNIEQRTGGSAALFGQFRAYDGRTGRAVSFGEIAQRCRRADVVFFGEQHGDVVCNELEAQILDALLRQKRPVALAMEFFEADTQPDLDAYLAGRIAEPPFRKQARQGRQYILSHRPLIELCRAARVPVIAANAPRKLVRGYRESGLSYDEYRAGLDPADQRWLPTHSEYLGGSYRDRFFETMATHTAGMPPATPAPTTELTTLPTSEPASQAATAPTSSPAPETPPVAEMPRMPDTASMYRAQLLWDDAMAESLANFRGRFPDRRVMLVVGGFHVERDGGTATKFQQRRPRDRTFTIAYRGTTDERLAFDAEDRGAGDIVIYGIAPPEEEERPPMRPTPPPPASAPAGQPTTEPAAAPLPEDSPTSAPAPPNAGD